MGGGDGEGEGEGEGAGEGEGEGGWDEWGFHFGGAGAGWWWWVEGRVLWEDLDWGSEVRMVLWLLECCVMILFNAEDGGVFIHFCFEG